MDYVEVMETALNHIERTERKTKVYKTRANPFDAEFKYKYRLSKGSAKKVIEMVRDKLTCEARWGSISPELQVLACLRYWGRGEIQDDCSDLHGISQPSMSGIAIKVATAIAEKAGQFVVMPRNILEQQIVIEQFQTRLGFPQAIGAIDCTHIKIKKVGDDSGQYYINKRDIIL